MDYIVYYICIHTIYPKYKMKKHIYTAAFFPIIFLITADALPAQELTCDAISCGSSTCKYFPANISDCRELYLDKIYHLHGLLTIFGVCRYDSVIYPDVTRSSSFAILIDSLYYS